MTLKARKKKNVNSEYSYNNRCFLVVVRTKISSWDTPKFWSIYHFFGGCVPKVIRKDPIFGGFGKQKYHPKDHWTLPWKLYSRIWVFKIVSFEWSGYQQGNSKTKPHSFCWSKAQAGNHWSRLNNAAVQVDSVNRLWLPTPHRPGRLKNGTTATKIDLCLELHEHPLK